MLLLQALFDFLNIVRICLWVLLGCVCISNAALWYAIIVNYLKEKRNENT